MKKHIKSNIVTSPFNWALCGRYYNIEMIDRKDIKPENKDKICKTCLKVYCRVAG